MPHGAMHARTGSRGPPPGTLVVVLVHGMIISSSYMVPAAKRLAPLCTVYAVELARLRSELQALADFGVPQTADALAAWVEAMGLARATSQATPSAARSWPNLRCGIPERVDQLVLQGPTVEAQARTLGQ